MSTSPIEIAPVTNKPRWRLAYCYTCFDGYRGGKASAEKWAAMHLKERHPETKATEPESDTE